MVSSKIFKCIRPFANAQKMCKSSLADKTTPAKSTAQRQTMTLASVNSTDTKDGQRDLVMMRRRMQLLGSQEKNANFMSSFNGLRELLKYETEDSESWEESQTSQNDIWPPVSPNAIVPDVQSIQRDDVHRLLHVTWMNGKKGRFAYVWLRDNCPAPHTYQLSEVCKARKMVMNDLDLDIEPSLVENHGSRIYVVWPDGKDALYESKWLAMRNLDDPTLRARRRQVRLDEPTITWDRDTMLQCMRWHNFDRLLNDDQHLHEALTELCRFGLIFVDRAPAMVGQLRRLADKIGFEYLTHYGHIFTVKSDANPTNVAYTSGGLGFHSDLPYLDYAPQLQALHCIEQTRTKGGENQFVDAFHVAEQLRRFESEVYKILCTVPLEYVDDGRDFIPFDLTYRRPVFSFDNEGHMSEVHFSNQQRSWFYDVPVDELYSVYKAMKTFNDYLNKKKNYLELKLQPGQMVLFHNLRVLHARSTFQMTAESGGRHMEGCYFNWDIIKSKIRQLRDKLDLQPNQISV